MHGVTIKIKVLYFSMHIFLQSYIDKSVTILEMTEWFDDFIDSTVHCLLDQ